MGNVAGLIVAIPLLAVLSNQILQRLQLSSVAGHMQRLASFHEEKGLQGYCKFWGRSQASVAKRSHVRAELGWLRYGQAGKIKGSSHPDSEAAAPIKPGTLIAVSFSTTRGHYLDTELRAISVKGT